MKFRQEESAINGAKEETGDMEKREQYTAEAQPNLKPSPQDGGDDTSEIKRGAKLTKVDATAILTTTIGMMQDAGWPIQIATMDGVAYLVIPGAKWVVTNAGWMLVEA